jgi:antitoxin HicB
VQQSTQNPATDNLNIHENIHGNVETQALSYRIFITKEIEGGYTVTVPSLPGCITDGENMEQAIGRAKEAIEVYIQSLKELGEEVPTEDQTFEYNLVVETDVTQVPTLSREGSRYPEEEAVR